MRRPHPCRAVIFDLDGVLTDSDALHAAAWAQALEPVLLATATGERAPYPPFDPRADNPTVDRPFVEDAAYDPDGNRFDLSTGKRDMDSEKARMEEYRKTAKPAKHTIE